jgi:hypothetical protein
MVAIFFFFFFARGSNFSPISRIRPPFFSLTGFHDSYFSSYLILHQEALFFFKRSTKCFLKKRKRKTVWVHQLKPVSPSSLARFFFIFVSIVHEFHKDLHGKLLLRISDTTDDVPRFVVMFGTISELLQSRLRCNSFIFTVPRADGTGGARARWVCEI